MGNTNSSVKSTLEIIEERFVRFQTADKNNDEFISMEEFELVYLEKTGDRPPWTAWMKFFDCDIDKDKRISIAEFVNFFNEDE